MEGLLITYIVLIVIAVVVQILLYKSKSDSLNSIFIMNVLLGITLSFITYTSLPSNFALERILAATWGIISIFSAVIKLRTKEYSLVSKLMISVAIVGSIVQLLL